MDSRFPRINQYLRHLRHPSQFFDLDPREFFQLTKGDKREFKYFESPVKVELAEDLTKQQLFDFPAFRNWLTALTKNLDLQSKPDHPFQEKPFKLQKITIQSVDRREGHILFLKLDAMISNGSMQLPGIAFLRGGSVAVLMIIIPKESRHERLVIMTEQSRVPAGSLVFREIPAGMIDAEQNFGGAAAREILEETGLEINKAELIDMTQLALREAKDSNEALQKAMYPSPGGSDEFISIFLWVKVLDRLEIEGIRGRLTGKRTRGELIKLYLCDYQDLWKEGARDAKTLAAWALYESLTRSGVLQNELEALMDSSAASLQRAVVQVAPSESGEEH